MRDNESEVGYRRLQLLLQVRREMLELRRLIVLLALSYVSSILAYLHIVEWNAFRNSGRATAAEAK